MAGDPRNGIHFIGNGELGWITEERRFGRYGTVLLEPNILRVTANKLEGKRGKLVAVPVKLQEPVHIGDLFLGIVPTKPELGEYLVLGEGTFFIFESLGYTNVGVRPDNYNQIPWLDCNALYKAVDQVVDLYLINEGELFDSLDRRIREGQKDCS